MISKVYLCFSLPSAKVFCFLWGLYYSQRMLFDLMINCFPWFSIFRPKKKKRDCLEDELTERDLKKNVNRKLQKRQNL